MNQAYVSINHWQIDLFLPKSICLVLERNGSGLISRHFIMHSKGRRCLLGPTRVSLGLAPFRIWGVAPRWIKVEETWPRVAGWFSSVLRWIGRWGALKNVSASLRVRESWKTYNLKLAVGSKKWLSVLGFLGQLPSLPLKLSWKG